MHLGRGKSPLVGGTAACPWDTWLRPEHRIQERRQAGAGHGAGCLHGECGGRWHRGNGTGEMTGARRVGTSQAWLRPKGILRRPLRGGHALTPGPGQVSAGGGGGEWGGRKPASPGVSPASACVLRGQAELGAGLGGSRWSGPAPLRARRSWRPVGSRRGRHPAACGSPRGCPGTARLARRVSGKGSPRGPPPRLCPPRWELPLPTCGAFGGCTRRVPGRVGWRCCRGGTSWGGGGGCRFPRPLVTVRGCGGVNPGRPTPRLPSNQDKGSSFLRSFLRLSLRSAHPAPEAERGPRPRYHLPSRWRCGYRGAGAGQGGSPPPPRPHEPQEPDLTVKRRTT